MRREFSPTDRAAILERDGGCLGPRIGMAFECDGPLEIDHVLNGGMGLKGPNTRENGASFCRKHHRTKTESARYWRPILVQQVRFLEGLEPLPHSLLAGCVGKVSFPTRKAARDASRRAQKTALGPLHAYRCECGAYHNGHRQP